MRIALRLTLCAVALALCAACAHGGSSTSSTSSSATQTSAAPPAAVASNGATIFQANCASCHQAAGQGVSGTFPPLAGNPVVTGPATAVIHIVKDGLSGPISVKGTSYNGQMPAWGQTLSASDIAAVVTYVRHSWGNSAAAVTAAQVASTP